MKIALLKTCGVACALASTGVWPLHHVVGSPESPSQYATEAVEQAELIKTVSATGTLNASINVEVGSQLSGQVAGLMADFNDIVKKGQVLAQLDRGNFQAQVDAASAALESAKADERISEARLSHAAIEARQVAMQKVVLQARVETATIALHMAGRSFDRKSMLILHGAEPLASVEDAGSRRDVARAALNEAQAVLATHSSAVESAQAEVTRCQAELEGAHATVKRLEALLRNAEVDLDRTNIRAPIDGIVVGRNVTQGQTLASTLEARTVFLLAGDLRQMEIYARVDETDISQISTGQDSTFTVDSFPGREFSAKVTQIRKAPQMLQNVVTYTVVLAVENDDYALLPGMTVLAKIVTKRTPASISVPLAALRYRHGAQFAQAHSKSEAPQVWVLKDDGKTSPVPVVLGDDDGNRVVVRGGDVHVYDKVIVGDEGGDRTGPSRGAR
jgi:HlyD family secretion protein